MMLKNNFLLFFSFYKKLKEDQYSIFFFTNFISLTFLFLIRDIFYNKIEYFDYLIFATSIICFEITYIFLVNNFIKTRLSSIKETLIFFIFLIFLSILWLNNNLFLDEIINFIFLLNLTIFFYFRNILEFKKKYTIKEFLLHSIYLFGFIGFFYQEKINLIDIFFIYSLIFFILFQTRNNKIFSTIDIFLSIIIFFVFFKVFLLSAEKDAFHYSWYLGPINSIANGGELLVDTASQYGYLNLELVSFLSNFFNTSSTKILIITIILFFGLFYVIFFYFLRKNLNLQSYIITIFLSLLLFSNLGFGDLNGSMFIPSSSVFRFLPVILFFLSLNLFERIKNTKKFSLFFFSSIFFLISILWSFENFLFTILTLLLSVLFCFILDFRKSILFFKNKYFLFFLASCIFLLLFFLKKDITFFYEYTFNFINSDLAIPFKTTKFELLFFSIILFLYLFWRSSLQERLFFQNFRNTYWFVLSLVFSSYYLSRSHPNNLFNLLPFLIFFSIQIKSTNLQIKKFFLFSVILITIVSSILSISENFFKFKNNLIRNNFLVLPYFEDINLPKILEDRFAQNSEIPVTIIKNKTIHTPLEYLNSKGYGMPILPLEQFNRLDQKRKTEILKKIFVFREKHFLLCLNSCNFYSSDKNMISWNDIFITKEIVLEQLILKDLSSEYKLYLLKKNF